MKTRTTIVLLLLPAALTAAPAWAGTVACATLESKVHAKLDRGLAACGRLELRKAPACEEAKWTKYDVRLAKAGCPIPQRTPSAEAVSEPGRHIRRPVAVAVRARDGRPGDLAAADRAVLDAFDDYVAVLRRLEKSRRAARVSERPDAFRVLTKEFVPIVRDALVRLRAAEDALASVEQSVWGSYPPRWRLDAVIDQPLAAAMEELQIELRRLLYPVFATEVPGLREMPGCRGDLIHDRLIAAFGTAMLTAGSDRSAETAALGRVATQLACLSAEQVGLLDAALAEASTRVVSRLAAAGLLGVDEAFARLMAPLSLLVLDAAKHEGEHAATWRWLVQHADVLRDQVARLGWPTGDVVWLYDRIEAQLVGFPPCRGEVDGRCVDLDTLLASVTDPRALGSGDCALSGMVAAGPRSLGNDTRYACPSLDCTAPSGGETDPRTGRIGTGTTIGGILDRFRATPQDVAALPWSGLGAADVAAMREVSCGSDGAGTSGGGGAGGGRTAQGPGGSLDDWGGAGECSAAAIAEAAEPFDAYTRCLIDASGAGTPEAPGGPSDPGSMRGVPSGGGCSPVADGGGSTPTTPTSTTTATTSPPTTTQPPSDPAKDAEEQNLVDTIVNLVTTFFSHGPSPVDPIINTEKTLLDPDNAKEVYGAVGAAWTHEIAIECASAGDGGLLSEAECKTLSSMPPGDQKEYYESKKRGAHDCAGPEDCDSGCTSLEQQVMDAFEDCTQQQIDDARPHVGPLDPIIDPSPEDAGGALPDDALTSCLLASPDGGRDVNLACGFVTCSDGPSTAMSAGACCGRAGGKAIGVAAGRLLGVHVCDQIHCAADFTVLDGAGACGCGSAGGGAGGAEPPAPSPGPVGPGGGVGR